MSKQQMRLRFIEGGEGGGTPASTDPVPTPEAGDQLGDAGKRALDAERATVKDLKAQLAAAKAAAPASKETPKEPAKDPEGGGDEVTTRLAELEKQLNAEKEAREIAEVSALRTRLTAGKLPPEIAELITGTTEEEITAQIDKLAPHIKSGPAPNPQQGNPSQGRGGSLAAGRDRYKQSHSS